jgi:hypothetical protein
MLRGQCVVAGLVGNLRRYRVGQSFERVELVRTGHAQDETGATTTSRTREVDLAARMGALQVEPAAKGPDFKPLVWLADCQSTPYKTPCRV